MTTGFFMTSFVTRLALQCELMRESFSLVKNSSGDNIAKSAAGQSPLVGYSYLSSGCKVIAVVILANSNEAFSTGKSEGIMAPVVEFSRRLLSVRQIAEQKLTRVKESIVSGITGISSPIEKLLFDILKNLVTFTASNHCMYGGKRYN